jgi:glycosyltransferase involved in cell wall biosynthesis
MMKGEAEVVWAHGPIARRTAVIVPLYNYAGFIGETLDSVAAQTDDDLCLIVINDRSTDNSLAVAKDWMESATLKNKSAFLLSHKANCGLSLTRNTGISFAESEFCFFLDSDNALYPRCVEKHAAALIGNAHADAAYSLIEVFDADSGISGANAFHPDRLKSGNYIDAMAMVRRAYLLQIEGYYPIKHGWEDYDLWLRMCEDDKLAIQIPEILSRYRVHGSSMLRTQTNIDENMRELCDAMEERHPWLELAARGG